MIRPFQLDDVFLIQRLGRQATKLNIVQSLLQRRSVLWASLGTIIPLNDGKTNTYVLRQQGHDLVGVGFLQAQRRPGRPEVDIVRMAPGLDAPGGHPAIWEKLLTHYSHEITEQPVARIYVDVPDQPLPVSTFCHVGFRVFARQTIWRLTTHGAGDHSHLISAKLRPQKKADEWSLKQMYARITPESVQLAEGMQTDSAVAPPILDWWQPGTYSNFVMEEQGEITGSVQVVEGKRGFWLQVWTDMSRPDPEAIHQLLRYGLAVISQRASRYPVYTSVCDYHGGLGAILSDYSFAPFTDRARMVKPVMQWVRHSAAIKVSTMEPATPIITTPFQTGDAISRGYSKPILESRRLRLQKLFGRQPVRVGEKQNGYVQQGKAPYRRSVSANKSWVKEGSS